MKIYLLLVLVFILPFLSQRNAYSAEDVSRFGIGAVLGEPTALTAEAEFDSRNSIDGNFGYTWGHSVLLSADYLFHFPGAFSTDSDFINQLSPYVGVGPELRFYSAGHHAIISSNDAGTVFSARIPLGLGWNIPKSAVKLYVEIAPVLDLVPGLDANMEAGIGARFYFY
jgi:hypothetical protein